ncbi:tigger transposable element-derived protein 2 [Contarinia nasturtii]|uniref:tigger transposable element-derived protein 2 n=1 Tax=Contarinia nasturtii TaxID=265458 RepID=UPI0012D3FAAF|nr:tigger transposable element-derived protein 2 [Contarinia nasturtii]
MDEDELLKKIEDPMEKSENKRNRFLSLKSKIDILNKLERGVRPIHIASEYGIALSTISRLKKCKTSLEEAMYIYQNNSDRRSLRGTFHPKMESELHKWYLEQIQNDVPVTGSVLRLKARELNKKIKENDLEFRASAGWMEKFKKRYGIRLKSSRGERQRTDNIAFDYDDHDKDANETKPEIVIIKTEDVVYEPAFVTVNNVEDDPPTVDVSNKGGHFSKVIQSVDDVIKWSVENEIEPLYLTMLKSLRERIRYKARN